MWPNLQFPVMENFIFCAVKQKKIVFDGIIADGNTN